MPRGDGTGPVGGGSGGGGGPFNAGAGGECVCTNCGYREAHVRGVPCNQKDCPNCGEKMVRA